MILEMMNEQEDPNPNPNPNKQTIKHTHTRLTLTLTSYLCRSHEQEVHAVAAVRRVVDVVPR